MERPGADRMWGFHPASFHRPLPKLGANRTSRLERAGCSGCAARRSMSSGPGQRGWNPAPGRRRCCRRSFGSLEAGAAQPGTWAGPPGGAEASRSGGGACAAPAGRAWLSLRPPGWGRGLDVEGGACLVWLPTLVLVWLEDCKRSPEGLSHPCNGYWPWRLKVLHF